MNTVSDEIMALFQQYGTLTYGEDCSLLEHAVQSGLIARDQGLDSDLVLSAFLHDIGHLIPAVTARESQKMGGYGMQSHEEVGAAWLEQRGFAGRVTVPIRYHVAAKRYLCSIDTSYWDRLSLPSKETMNMQGGFMSEEEIMAFEALPLHDECVLIRKIDDEAKTEDFSVLPEFLDYFRALLEATI